ncbi:sulfatase-like hydrolase/transferase, partial [Kaarinaea lacus]
DAGDDGLEVPSLGEYEKLDWPKPQKAYAAMVTRLDSYVGSILEELAKQGIDKNTIVFFSSDNGPHKESGNDPEFFNSASNLRGLKRELYEGGIRVPMIAWAPGLIKGGSVSDHVSYFPDVLPTIMEMSGIAINRPVDGISFYPALAGNVGNQKEHEFLYWEYHGAGGSRALRMGNWKSVISPYEGFMELYDLDKDPGEKNDVSDEYKDIVSLHNRIIEREHTDLPLKDEIRLYLKREQINKNKLMNVTLFVIAVLIVIGYVLVRKKRKRSAV